MAKYAFWTQRRFTGLTLLLGCFLFLGAVGLIPQDAHGNLTVSLPPRAALLVIAAQTTRFEWSTSLLIGGVVITALGFTLLVRLLWDSGERTLSLLALVVLLLGVVLRVIYLAFWLGVNPFAAQETASIGVVPAYYVPLTMWTTALGRVYTVFAFSALALTGGALLVSQVLPRWLSWTAIVYGLAGLGLFAYALDIPPILHHLLPIVMGILLLLRRYQIPAVSHQQEASAVASTRAVEKGPTPRKG